MLCITQMLFFKKAACFKLLIVLPMNAFSRDNPTKLTDNEHHYCSQSAHQFHYMIVESSPELWIKLQPHITGRGDHITASNTIIGIEEILACQAIDAVLIRLDEAEELLSASLNLRQNYPNLPVVYFLPMLR